MSSKLGQIVDTLDRDADFWRAASAEAYRRAAQSYLDNHVGVAAELTAQGKLFAKRAMIVDASHHQINPALTMPRKP